ncbi:MAG TPA: ABC transporter permease [Anaerolineales bacterium]|nr:ABC transporter permease [Anaerolineales bacterium]HLF01033.1 ABC transporter permease [Anaerolineales bacterium]
MTTTINELKASYAFIERNYNIVKRYWAWELVWLVYTVANSLAVSYIGLGFEQMGGGGIDGKYFVLYLAVGTIVWRYLSVIFYWVTDLVGLERWEGTIEYTLMAPITRFFHMLGQTAFAIVYSLIHTAVVLLATMLLFDISLSNANLFGFVLLLVAGSLSFIGISIVGSVLPLLFPERGSQMTHLIIAVLLLVSGVYYPVEVLPNWLQVFAAFSPATYVIDGARATLLDGAPTLSLWQYIWPLLVMGAISIPAGLRIFRWAEDYAKRTGKLHRNG